MKKIDLTGSLVGTLRVTGPAPARNRKLYWLTHCTVCARDSEHRADTLTGSKPSARCTCSDARISHGATRKGGKGVDPLYPVWTDVKRRVKLQPYRYPLELQTEWQEFTAFRRDILADIGPRPSKRHSLDRNDFFAGYIRSNVRWLDAVGQANNRSSSKIYDCSEIGLALTAHEWSRLLNEISGQPGRWTRADVQLFLDRLQLTPVQMIAAVVPPPPDRHHTAGKRALETLLRKFDHQGWWDTERADNQHSEII